MQEQQVNKRVIVVLFISFDQYWDIGKGFKIPEVYRTGYTVLGLSLVTSIALALM